MATKQRLRKILIDFMHLYKDLPYLWNTTHRLYSNKEARERGWALLLGKYQLWDEEATIDTIKKKIDHMRSVYRREHKKVLAAEIRGRVYKPTLWYYDLLSFLHNNPGEEIAKTESDAAFQEYEELDEVFLQNENDENSFSENEMPLPKRTKLSTVFIEDHHNPRVDSIGNASNFSVNDTLHDRREEEVEVFGRTVGLQLKELNPTQKIIAEKLISDVIYHGRLEQLNRNSTLTLNEEM